MSINGKPQFKKSLLKQVAPKATVISLLMLTSFSGCQQIDFLKSLIGLDKSDSTAVTETPVEKPAKKPAPIAPPAGGAETNAAAPSSATAPANGAVSGATTPPSSAGANGTAPGTSPNAATVKGANPNSAATATSPTGATGNTASGKVAATTPGSNNATAPNTAAPVTATAPKEKAADLTVDADGLSKSIVVIETTKGTIQYKFYPKDAPKTVKRIAELIQKGFYNGLVFHRVVPGFVIQGGDPTGTGAGGSGQKLAAEFNSRKHLLGSVAMARAQDPNSADSQFYIALSTIPHLDNQYTVFGKVISGIEVVQKIAQGDKMTKVFLK